MFGERQPQVEAKGSWIGIDQLPFCNPAVSGQALFVDVVHLYDPHTCLGVEAGGIGEAAAVHAQLNGGNIAGIELSEGVAKEGRAETFFAPRATHA